MLKSDDIYFYDFDLNLVYILPSFGTDKGYISMNVQKDFNDFGSLEIVFIDSKLKSIIKEHKDNLIVTWKGFQGFLTGHQFDRMCRAMGMSLNGLLHRIVIPKTVTVLNGTVEALARSAISSNATWLSLGDEKGFETSVDYSTDTYKTADRYIPELLALDNAGFEIYADIPNKEFIFRVLKSQELELMFSTNNLNAYDFVENYSNKKVAYGGWYEKEQSDGSDPVWTYITTDETLTGINVIDTVLSSKNEDEALQELKSRAAELEIDLKTKKVQYGVDYNLGDIVRVQNDDVATKKKVIGIIMSKEKGFTENPILSEVE